MIGVQNENNRQPKLRQPLGQPLIDARRQYNRLPRVYAQPAHMRNSLNVRPSNSSRRESLSESGSPPLRITSSIEESLAMAASASLHLEDSLVCCAVREFAPKAVTAVNGTG